MRWRSSAVAALVLALSACAGERPRGGFRPAVDTPVKIGLPYRAGGRMWVPMDDRQYDAVGYASWYGGAHAGKPTANGEKFVPGHISAAHPTLPLPSYVEVTALATGRTVLVRVNDRGPFTGGRIIDLSEGAAKALGIRQQGVAAVRVRRVEPREDDRASLRMGRSARSRPDMDRKMLALMERRLRAGAPASGAQPAAPTRPLPLPQTSDPTSIRAGSMSSPATGGSVATFGMSAARPAGVTPANREVGDRHRIGMATAGAIVPRRENLYIDIATLNDADRADGLAANLPHVAPVAVIPAGRAWCVRLGPFVDSRAAQAALESVARAGYHDARIVRESAEGQGAS